MVRLLDPNLAAQQSILLAEAGRERPILDHLHLPQEVFQEVYSDAVSEQTYYRWRQEYGGLRTDQAKRLKELEAVSKPPHHHDEAG